MISGNYIDWYADGLDVNAIHNTFYVISQLRSIVPETCIKDRDNYSNPTYNVWCIYLSLLLIWGRQDPGGPHVDPNNLAIWVVLVFFTQEDIFLIFDFA